MPYIIADDEQWFSKKNLIIGLKKANQMLV